MEIKENKYDNNSFFNEYKKMSRSVLGLKGAGEWHELKKLMPDFKNKKVLDLGCGFGWHCHYAVENGANFVLGIDISKNMLDEAKKRNFSKKIKYLQIPIEDFDYPKQSFDVVISSLAFHYIENFEDICKKVYNTLTPNGKFIFSVEHPVFTAYGNQDWYYDKDGNILHWPVDNYYFEGKRKAIFLGCEVTKYHRTITSYINALLKNNFEINSLVEPQPDETMMNIPGMKDELRRPMMLIISATKK